MLAKHSKKPQTIKKTIEASTTDFAAQATENRELFREAAAKAYEAFGDTDRKICQQLQAGTITIQDVLDTWKQRLRHVRDTLEQRRSDTHFIQYLADKLFITSVSATEKASQLVTVASTEFLQSVVDKLYPTSIKNAHQKQQIAKAFLSQPDIAIDDFYQRYVAFTAAVETAKLSKITIYDSMGTWVERQRALSIIKKERQKTLKQQRERLAIIASETTKLRQLHNNLLNELFERDWDIFEIKQLYDIYAHELSALPKKEQASPTKLLSVFNNVTTSFLDRQIRKASQKSPDLGLNGLRSLSEEVNKLLLRFFDLTDDEKQLLLESATTCQALYQEEAEIKHMQQLSAKL